MSGFRGIVDFRSLDDEARKVIGRCAVIEGLVFNQDGYLDPASEMMATNRQLIDLARRVNLELGRNGTNGNRAGPVKMGLFFGKGQPYDL